MKYEMSEPLEMQMQRLTLGFRLKREVVDDLRQLREEAAFSVEKMKEALRREPLIPRLRRHCGFFSKTLKATWKLLVEIWGLID